MIQNEQEFNEWYNQFYQKYKGIRPQKDWFRYSVKAHEKIAEFLGGQNKSLKIELDDKQCLVDQKIALQYAALLVVEIPSYFQVNQVTIADLSWPFIKNKGNKKWGKDIRQFIDNESKLGKQYNIDKINDIISKLGQEWVKCKTVKDTCYVTMSVSPQTFCLLGHYYPDKYHDSCFKQKGQHNIDKYVLGQSENSFVILISKDPIINLDEQKKQILARCWGLTRSLERWHLTNLYYVPDIKEGNAYKCLIKFFESLLNKEGLMPYDGRFSLEGAYKNRTKTLSFFNNNSPIADYFYLNKKDGLESIKFCTWCKNCEDNLEDVDDNFHVCKSCVPNQGISRCEYSGHLTMQNLISARDEDHKPISIFRRFFEDGTFKYCSITGHRYHKDQLEKISGGVYGNKKKIKEYNYVECENCGLMTDHLISNTEIYKRLCSTCNVLLSPKRNVKYQPLWKSTITSSS
jgi:hypothetical protein